jgi:hypothetical protein
MPIAHKAQQLRGITYRTSGLFAPARPINFACSLVLQGCRLLGRGFGARDLGIQETAWSTKSGPREAKGFRVLPQFGWTARASSETPGVRSVDHDYVLRLGAPSRTFADQFHSLCVISGRVT